MALAKRHRTDPRGAFKMIKNRMSARILGFLVSVGVLAVAMNNCDNVKLSLMPPPVVQASKAIPEICAFPPTEKEKLTKILFVVDSSGSNFTGPGTDPDKSYRYNLMKDFIDKHSHIPQIYYGMIIFRLDKAIAYINDGNDQSPVFTNDLSRVDAALDRFMSEPDEYTTPYRAALTMAQYAITADRLKSGTGAMAEYRVVMLSDGVPTDYGDPINDAAIDSDVQALIVAASEATLTTIYYGPNDASAAARLERMANRGNGQFSNVNVDGRIPLDQIMASVDGEPWVIKRFMVTNLTSAPCDDGTMGADSDADGICDKDEERYNQELPRISAAAQRMGGKFFSPTKRNSFGNVYNDYLNYRRIVYNETLNLDCKSTSDDDRDLLNECEESFVSAAMPVGPTDAWTSKMGTAGDPKNYDSDGDGFLDYVELIFGRSQSAALDFNSSVHLMTEGYRFDDILTQHRHPMRPSQSEPYELTFHFTHVNEKGQNCYTYNQKALALYKTKALSAADAPGAPQLAHGENENVILVYYIQTPERDPSGPGVLSYAYLKIPFEDNAEVDLGAISFQNQQPVGARVSAK